VQVVFDCRDPDGLSKFYAEALRYKAQDPPEGFKSWEEALKARGIPEEDWNSGSAIVDPEGERTADIFSADGHAQTRKELRASRRECERRLAGHDSGRQSAGPSEVERLFMLGAAEQREWEERGEYWVVMLDPEGNEFCVQ